MIPRSKRSPVPLSACSLARSIDVIGDRWSLLVLRAALYGVRRFADFQSELDMPRTVLSARLKRLVEAGLLTRQLYRDPGKRSRAEYVLTDMGAELRPALIALTQWGDKWLNAGEAPIQFASRKSGGRVRAGFVDDAGRPVADAELKVVLRR